MRMRKPEGRAASTAAVAIDGADSQGKANDKEVCGDAAAVSQRRSEALRRRAAAIQERLDKIKPVAKAPVSAAALAADRAEMQRVDGIAAKTAGKVATEVVLNVRVVMELEGPPTNNVSRPDVETLRLIKVVHSWCGAASHESSWEGLRSD